MREIALFRGNNISIELMRSLFKNFAVKGHLEKYPAELSEISSMVKKLKRKTNNPHSNN